MNYITYNTFEIKKENKEMEKVLPYLIGNINNEGFKALNRLLTAAKKVEKNNLYEFKGEANNLEYEWLNNADPLNLVLGYIVDCCAKYKGAGEDIMIQSMTNPNFKNLVIYKGSEVVAKSTAFYNNNYILCNNIEVSDKYMKNKNNKLDEKRKLLEMIVKGLKDQAEAMNQNGNNVDEIRIGMSRNDLNYIIEFEQYNIEKNNLLKNYEFKRYQGDANNKAFGQAIIYKK
jgi:rubrerythrin